MREFGFSKDDKPDEFRIVLALISDEKGLPLSYKVFPGSTPEMKT